MTELVFVRRRDFYLTTKSHDAHPWGVHMVLWVACPWAGVGACQGEAAPVVDLILEEQEVEAPCQEEQAGAWASEAYLSDGNNTFFICYFVNMLLCNFPLVLSINKL